MDFTMERQLSAPLEQVWAAWTDAELLAQWYSPGPMSCRVEENDLREGGAYRRVMMGPDHEHVDQGIYHAIDAPHHLVQGTPDKAFVIDTALESTNGGTKMTLGMDGLPKDDEPHVRQAWTSAFDKLEALLAN